MKFKLHKVVWGCSLAWRLHLVPLLCKGTVEWLQWRPDSRLSLKYYPYSLALVKPRSNKFQFLNFPGTDSARTPFLFSLTPSPLPLSPSASSGPRDHPRPPTEMSSSFSLGGGAFLFFFHSLQGSQSTFMNTIRNSTTSF